jgi:hypothetical protein
MLMECLDGVVVVQQIHMAQDGEELVLMLKEEFVHIYLTV